MIRIFDDRVFPFLAAAAVITVVAAMWLVFFYAPIEATLGISQKIFYVHVPSAMAAYAGFTVAAVCSLFYLLKPKAHWDIAAVTGAELGLIFCFFVLFSGSLWGYKAWGTWWTWDPQLTATFILFLLFGAYVLLRFFGGKSRQIKKVSAVLAIVAFVDIPIIHYAVRIWGGIHPQVEREGGGGLAPDIQLVFQVSMLAILLVFIVLFWMRFRVRLDEERVEELYLEVEDLAMLQQERR